MTSIVPRSQVNAAANESGIEWAILTISTENGPAVEGLGGQHVLDLHVLEPVLVELGAHHRGGQRPAVDRQLAPQLAQHERQRPHVVLVPVGQHDRLDVVGPLAQVGEVGQHQIDPELVGRREHQPGVDHDDAAVVLDDHHVLADLAEPAERQDPEGAGRAHTAASSSWRSSAARMTAFSSSVASTIGSRSPPTSWPAMFTAALIGVGLVVTDSAS